MGANIFRQSVLILLILAFVGIAGVSAATVNYYTLNEPVTTPQGLTLESFRVSGENPEVSVGDTVNVMQMMSYLSGPYYQLIIDQPGGLSFDIVNPEGRAYRLGSNYVGKTISQGDYVSVKDSFVPDIAGVWKIKPSFTVTSGTARGKFFPPETWPVAEITVAAVEDPKPDLVIEGVTADFDYKDGMITKITYVVKNVGDVDAGESVSKIMIDGAEVAESSVGFLPAGKSLTVFVPVNVKYNGPSSLIEVTPNANKAVDEANHENNYFDAIIDNPADSSVTTITAGPTSESLSQSATTGTGGSRTDVVSADTCLAYTQNCNSIFTCSVIGLLAILLSAVTFALGYFYGVSKNCTKEMAWMRSKISYLRSTDPNAAEKGESDSGSGSSSGPSSAAEKFIEKYYGESASEKKDDAKDGEKDGEKDGAKEDDKKSDDKKADTDKSDDADAKKSESKDKKDKDSKDRKDADKDKSRNKDKSADIEFEYAEESDESESAKK